MNSQKQPDTTCVQTAAHPWFAPIQAIILMLAAPLFVFPRPWLWPVFAIVPLLWTTRKILRKQWMQPTPIDYPLVIFLTAVLISALRFNDFPHGLPKITGILLAVALFYALIDLLQTEKYLRRALYFFLVGGLLFSIIGLLGMPTFKVKHLDLLMKIKDNIPRLNFGLPGAELGFAPTVVGGILLLFIPLALTMTLTLWKHKNKTTGHKLILFFLLTTLPVIGLVFLLTQARGAWLGAFISTITITPALLIPKMKKKKKLTALLTGLLVLVIIIGTAVLWAARSGQMKPGIKQAEGTLMFRVQLWDQTLPLIQSHPWKGIGINNFRRQTEVRYFLSHAHNQFLHTAVELGVPAAASWLAILLITGWMCARTWRGTGTTWHRMAALGLGWGQLAHFFFCLTDAIPHGAKVGILFWFSLALITALYKIQEKQNQP